MTPVCNVCRHMKFKCTHPEAYERSSQAVQSMPCFLGFSRSGEYLLDKKTSPRWCPRRKG